MRSAPGARARFSSLRTAEERNAMTDTLDDTHDPSRRSFVEEANDGENPFPIQNLPLGIFGDRTDTTPRPGVAVGNEIFDLKRASQLKMLPASISKKALEAVSLNALFALGASALRDLRSAVADLLDGKTSVKAAWRRKDGLLHSAAECVMHRPTIVGNYTDFYSGIHHAIAAGSLMQPNDPLPPNYKWVPIAHHGRASSVQIEGGMVKRPLGQLPS
jgi:fumarylacetoacetase